MRGSITEPIKHEKRSIDTYAQLPPLKKMIEMIWGKKK